MASVKIENIQYGAKRNSNWATAWWDKDYYYYIGQGGGSYGGRYNWGTCIKFSLDGELGANEYIKITLPTDTDRKNSTWISQNHCLKGFISTTGPKGSNFGKAISGTEAISITNEKQELLTNFKNNSGVVGYLFFKLQQSTSKTYYMYIYPVNTNNNTIDFEPWTWWRGKSNSIKIEIIEITPPSSGGGNQPSTPPEVIPPQEEKPTNTKKDIKIFDGTDWKSVDSIWIYTNDNWKEVEDCKIYENGKWKDVATS